MTTTRIQFLQGVATDACIYNPGDCTDWDSVEAQRFVVAGIAKIVDSPPPLEDMVTDRTDTETFKPINKKNKGKLR
jgi:hypothetical protein